MFSEGKTAVAYMALNSDFSSPDTCFPIKPWYCQTWCFSLNVSKGLQCSGTLHFNVNRSVLCLLSNGARVKILQGSYRHCVLLCNLAWTII